jgi:hypothetical protein
MCSILPADAEFARSGNRPPKDWACPEHFHLLVNTLSQGGTQPLTFGDWTAIAVFNVSIRLPHSMATPESTPTDD